MPKPQNTLSLEEIVIAVYSALDDALREAKIPYGKLATYQQLAKKSGFPRGARFVGNVMRKNRLPLFYPCHRVVRTDGGLGGYGPGLAWKKRLLALERKGK